MTLKDIRERITKMPVRTAAAALAAVTLAGAPVASAAQPKGAWLSGDFHQHTLYTDGSTTFDFVMRQSNDFGLDWWANSEHGGERNRNGDGLFWDDLGITILGARELSGGKREMWRWQSLRDFAFPEVLDARALYPDRRIFSGLEWNVPGHEHCSTAIVAEDAAAISAFEYQFDNSDDDFMSGDLIPPYASLPKQNGKINFSQGATSVLSTGKSYPERHADAVKGCQWMQDQYSKGIIDNGWIIFAHVERDGAWSPSSGGGYNVEHFRDFNNAAPDVCFGFEGAPGHQVNDFRGFGNNVQCDASGACTSDDFGGTYGGVGYYSAKVGGLWDALLGEGRRWFNFASSDYHRHYTNSGGDDFYPGEYQKTWVYTVDQDADGQYSLNEIADALRSGNAWFVHGDLVSHLEFEAQNRSDKAPMGGELTSEGPIRNLKLKIRLKSPETNHCAVDGVFIKSCAEPRVDHVDLIAGEITGRIAPTDPSYTNATHPTAKVIASFDAKNLPTDEDGFITIVHHIKDVDRSTYFRLRGTNLACGAPNETGPATALPSADYCSPLADALVTANLGIDGAQEAWDDLWFYSNPIFVIVK
jgi:hypothetical protein